jgi:hypothetical protein
VIVAVKSVQQMLMHRTKLKWADERETDDDQSDGHRYSIFHIKHQITEIAQH